VGVCVYVCVYGDLKMCVWVDLKECVCVLISKCVCVYMFISKCVCVNDRTLMSCAHYVRFKKLDETIGT